MGDAAVDAGPQRWLVVDDQEWRRLLAAHDGDHLELYLFLTREQARLLHSEPPLLLSGTAGSGKTTIAVDFLLRHRVRRLTPAPDAATAPADPVARAVSADPGARGMPAHGPARGSPRSAAPDGPHAPAAFPRAGAEGSTARSAAQERSSRPVARGVGFSDAGVGPAGAERALFLTCSAHLKRFSERIYRGLVKATELEHTPEAVRFATLGELLSEILGHAGRPEWQAPPAGLAEFGAILRNHPGAARYDTELVWEEIRSIIKGAKAPVSRRRFAELAARFVAAQAAARDRAELAEYVVRLANLEAGVKLDGVRARKTAFGSLEEFAVSLRDGLALRRGEQLFLLDAAVRFLDKQSARLDQPLLTLREYEGLGHKRAPNFPFDRRDIHRIAEYYQKRLDAEARYDEIDQTRAVLHYLERHGDQFRYDLVVCDEVQDFTDMQLALLFRLAGDPRRTVLTGDPKQIINPSGFRWEEVRARYYERGLPVPPVINLSINFRSVGNIVSLANEVLLLKRSLIGVASGEIAERWTFRGRPPLLVDGLAEAGLLEAIRRGGAGQVVLVRTEAERDRVRAALRTELVFTIGEAKGLEFDAVLLWRFPTALGSAAIWRRIASGRVQGAADAPHIRHELNLLYVAVTRGAQHPADLGRRAGQPGLGHRWARRTGVPVRRCRGHRQPVAAGIHARRVARAGRLLHGARALRGGRGVLSQRPGGHRGGAGARPPAGAGGRAAGRRRRVHPPGPIAAGGGGAGARRGVRGCGAHVAPRRQRDAGDGLRGEAGRGGRRLRRGGGALAAAGRRGGCAAQLAAGRRFR